MLNKYSEITPTGAQYINAVRQAAKRMVVAWTDQPRDKWTGRYIQ